jgi:hypothetical protein
MDANGGARRIRTDDLKLAKLALSQLSYGPKSNGSLGRTNLLANRHLRVVGLGRFELPTSRLSSARSNQLSYRPGKRDIRPSEERETKAAASRDRWVGSNRFQGRSHCSKSSREAGRCARSQSWLILRKEVIQPQVPLRLPCYDFTPVADLTVAGCLLAVSAPSSGKANSHGVTGGVYKARERIHRGVLIRDY